MTSGAVVTSGVVHGYVFHFTEGKAAGRLGILILQVFKVLICHDLQNKSK